MILPRGLYLLLCKYVFDINCTVITHVLVQRSFKMVAVNYKYHKESKYGWTLSGLSTRNDAIGVVSSNTEY